MAASFRDTCQAMPPLEKWAIPLMALNDHSEWTIARKRFLSGLTSF
jgi:hypothetical protein